MMGHSPKSAGSHWFPVIPVHSVEVQTDGDLTIMHQRIYTTHIFK